LTLPGEAHRPLIADDRKVISHDQSSEDRRRALLGAVSSMHEAHDRRQSRASRLHGARIATIGDDPFSRYELAEIAERCDGTIVRLDDDPTLVIRRGRFLVTETQALRQRGILVIDALELAEMQVSHDFVYRPESLRKACRRAVEGSNGRRLVLPPRDPAQRVEEAARTGGFVTRHGRRFA
jgi:hypothetical protein